MRDTIDMAREAGFEQVDQDVDEWICFTDEIERFEALVRADERDRAMRENAYVQAEREACAQIAADYGPSRPIVSKNPSSQIVGRWEGEQAASGGIAAAIRARGENT